MPCFHYGSFKESKKKKKKKRKERIRKGKRKGKEKKGQGVAKSSVGRIQKEKYKKKK